jgi:hypothetical protein
VELCIRGTEAVVVSADGSINLTNLFQSEFEGTCQPDGQIFLFPLEEIPLAAYQLYR